MFLLKPKNLIKIICHSLLIFSIIFILVINSFPWFINIKSIQNQFFQIITNQTQLYISADKIDIDLFPEPNLKFDDFTIKSISGIEYSIKTISIFPDLKKIIQGELVISKIALADSKLNLLDEFTSKLSNNNSFKIPDMDNFFLDNKLSKYIDKAEGLSIHLKNFKQDFAEKLDISLSIRSNNSFTGTIEIKNFVLNKELLRKYKFSKKIFNFNSKQNNELIHITKLKTNFNITKDKTIISISPTLVKYPAMTLGIDFTHYKKPNKAQIEFSGYNVNINQVKKAYFDLFNKEDVSENLFDIVRAGNASKITVLFKEKNLENLFTPENMILNGELENGNIKIPNTLLIPRNVFGAALIKSGILYISAHKGKLKNSTFSRGKLKIDILNHDDYPFNGSFKIHAPISDIRLILIESFKGTLLAEELKLVNNIQGIVDGELLLEQKSGKDLNVTVIVDNIKGSGKYKRAPGKIKINMGKFQYKDNIVTLSDFAGKIGKSYFHDFTGFYTIDDTNFIAVKSGKALIDSTEVFNWLTGFQEIKNFIPNVFIKKGYLQIDSTNITGDLLNPEELYFYLEGSMDQTLINYNLFENNLIDYTLIKPHSKMIEQSISSCDFQISDKELSFDKINAEISDIGIFKLFTENKEIENIATPFTLSNGSYKSASENKLFTGTFSFPTGPEINFKSQNNNKGSFSLKELKIQNHLKTDATFTPDSQDNFDFFKFDGQINTKTLEKIFKTDSLPYQKLIGYTDKKDIIIKSKNNSTYSIITKTIDVEPFVDRFFLKQKKNPLEKEKQVLFFPEKHIKFESDSLIYKQNNFNKFIAHLSIKKNDSGFNGKIELSTKDGYIHKLTLLSRILSVVNIATLLKGRLPDIMQNGFKYHSIDIKADIVNNSIVLKKALIDGHDMALVFTGTIDLVKNDLDLTCLVAPFKTIDMLIEKIPFVNKALNNTLISIPVTISGKIDDPRVIPLNPVSVGKGIINLMTNIIKTPFKLLKKIPKIGKRTVKDRDQ